MNFEHLISHLCNQSVWIDHSVTGPYDPVNSKCGTVYIFDDAICFIGRWNYRSPYRIGSPNSYTVNKQHVTRTQFINHITVNNDLPTNHTSIDRQSNQLPIG